MTPEVLITGAQGFVGAQLVKRLRAKGYTVHTPTLELTDLTSFKIPEVQTSLIVLHLAGMSFVPDCEKNPDQARAVNTQGTMGLLEKFSTTHYPVSFWFASTAQVYDESDQPLTESSAIKPRTVYAQTKWQAEEAVRSWSSDKRLGSKGAHRSSVVFRFFNHTHKTQPPHFFLPHVYQSLLKKPKTIPVGNLDLYRDIGSVQDLIRAIQSLIDQTHDASEMPQQSETYNICSSTPKHLGKLAQELALRLGNPVEFVRDPSRIREGELKTMVGSCEKLTQRCGFVPTAKTEALLIDAFLEDL